jgi:diguanylate cyclase (GGDEF)-like protein
MKRAEERLLADAVRDRVTGLPNRALFLDRLEVAMRRAHTESNRELYVIVIDLDRFKTVNEGLGFEAGDSLLSVTARRLSGLIGPEDSLARLPGDQFGVIFNGKKPKRDVIPFTEQLRGALSRPIRLRNRELFLTASYGVARFVEDPTSAEDFIKDAEIALYEAKRRGRDSIEFFRQDMRTERSELMSLEQDLRKAIERSEIEVAFQPVARLSDTQLAGFEALIRWRHRTHGLLAPDAFIALAEETGVIKELNRHVLNEAARQLGIWQRAFRPEKPLFVSVNVSSNQLLSADLVEDVRALLGREDILPGTLKLELTETLVMENPELTVEILERLKALGIGLACDDFGTGYSALASLRRLPFDTLKIDKSFLEADPEDEKAMIILETIILLAHDLGLDVIAEGIEGEEQRARLAELECDFGQGFFFGEPMTAKQVVEALGGSGYLGSKPGIAGFWDRVTSRKPSDKPKGLPAGRTAALSPPPADTSSPETLLLPDIPAPAVPKSNGSRPGAVSAPDDSDGLESETNPDLPVTEKAVPIAHAEAAAPRKAPARTFKSTLTLPQPGGPPPPRRPADIFGLSPRAAHSPAPRPGTAVPAPRIRRPVKPVPAGNELSPEFQPQSEPQSPPQDIEAPAGSQTAEGHGEIAAERVLELVPPPPPSDAAVEPVAQPENDDLPETVPEPPILEPQPEIFAPEPAILAPEQPFSEPQAGADSPADPKVKLGQMLRKAGKRKSRVKPG